ncbi:MAG TPA: hypothetical protein VM182_12100 [Terriglobia bacterium]|nr:hypothetical protein [Terriglobia bacterium]
MSLRKSPTLDSAALAANRRNAAKSTGPRTAVGKARARHNALQHGRHAASDVSRETMLALGEDPREFENLYQSLLCAYEPADPLWAKQVEDLAKLYWRRGRLERARDGLLRREMETVDADQERRRLELDRDFLTTEEERRADEEGLCQLKDSPAKFRRILICLKEILEAVEARDFTESSMPTFRTLYGKYPSWSAARIRRLMRWFVSPPSEGAPPDEETYQLLLGLVREEIQLVEREYELYRRAHSEVTPAARAARLVPAGKNWSGIQREEIALDRAIDRKVKILLSLRRARGSRAGGREEVDEAAHGTPADVQK